MSLRETVIQNHIGSEKIVHIVAHHYSRYVIILFKYVLILVPLYRVFLLLSWWIANGLLSTVLWVIALSVYCKIIIDFLNYYLDAIILTPTEMIVFKREGILNYKTEHIALDSIEGISYTQYGLWDVMWDAGDITIRLNHGVTIPFDSIPDPKHQTQNLMNLKEDYLMALKTDQETNDIPQDKFEILVQTLSDLIIDHVHKKDDSWVS